MFLLDVIYLSYLIWLFISWCPFLPHSNWSNIFPAGLVLYLSEYHSMIVQKLLVGGAGLFQNILKVDLHLSYKVIHSQVLVIDDQVQLPNVISDLKCVLLIELRHISSQLQRLAFILCFSQSDHYEWVLSHNYNSLPCSNRFMCCGLGWLWSLLHSASFENILFT